MELMQYYIILIFIIISFMLLSVVEKFEKPYIFYSTAFLYVCEYSALI